MQVGDQLGFKVTTTTETSTLESVQFLDVGVVLTIRPRITRDGRVLLNVKPEVSTGEVNPETGLPEESTTELETDVMLEDGQGMVIGGLIKETDSVVQRKMPYLGDVKGLGWFFRHSEVTKERVEIIVALVPRIQPYDAQWQAFEQGELVKAGVPLFHGQHGPLKRAYRPWDPILPDGKRVYRPLIPRNHGHHGAGLRLRIRFGIRRAAASDAGAELLWRRAIPRFKCRSKTASNGRSCRMRRHRRRKRGTRSRLQR